jgi:Holliday junction resolvasome RuvABC endonuclease subunit
LIQTTKSQIKSVRVSSDNLARARALYLAFKSMEKMAQFVAAEIPSGSQSSKAAMGFGVATGVLASHSVPLIEVSPTETKVAAVGDKHASKADIIGWATNQWPGLDWIKNQKRLQADKGLYHKDNEHTSDAIAIIYAAINTPHFQAAIALTSALAAE